VKASQFSQPEIIIAWGADEDQHCGGSGIGLCSLKGQVEQVRMTETRNPADVAHGAEAAMGAQGVSETIADLRLGAGETGTPSEQVLTAACGLTQGSTAFDQAVRVFLAEVKAT
jgi:hypothetical protein